MRREHDMDPNHRRRLKAELVARMYADYKRLKSLEKVGDLYGRTRQAMFSIFETHGLELNHKVFLPVIKYAGMKFTQQKICGRHRYLRATVRKKGQPAYLHHAVWRKHRGAIPPGHKLVFKDGNHRNVRIGNLLCMTVSEQVRRGNTGANQFTKSAKARLGVLLGNFGAGKRTVAAEVSR